jgi:hypothetical protein
MGASQVFSLQPFKENGGPEYVRPTAFREISGAFKRARNGRLRAGSRAPEVPVPCFKSPVLQKIFPVNLGRELLEKRLQHSGFLLRNRPGSLKNAKFPVKFPVSREFAWRRVRSALRRQPASPGHGDFALSNAENARQWRAFAHWRSVSRLQIWPLPGQNSR